MSRPSINFSWNWNSKLYCKCFTTIRIANPHKYNQLNGRDLGPGIIRDIKPFVIGWLTPFMAMLDMGLTVEKAKQTILTMYKNKGFNFYFILIEQPEKIPYPLPTEFFEINEAT